MGFYAGSFGGNDTRPAADFHRPPASIDDRARSRGMVQDRAAPAQAGVTVRLAFQGAGAANPDAP